MKAACLESVVFEIRAWFRVKGLGFTQDFLNHKPSLACVSFYPYSQPYEPYMVVSLKYCSQNGGNLYRAPYYNGNPNIGPRIIGNLDQSPYNSTTRDPLHARPLNPGSRVCFNAVLATAAKAQNLVGDVVGEEMDTSLGFRV